MKWCVYPFPVTVLGPRVPLSMYGGKARRTRNADVLLLTFMPEAIAVEKSNVENISRQCYLITFFSFFFFTQYLSVEIVDPAFCTVTVSGT